MIESPNNARIINYAKLNNKKYRDESEYFIVEGQHLVEEALKLSLVKEIFLLNDEENTYGEVTYVSQSVMRKLSVLDSPPNVIAIVRKLISNTIEGNILIVDDLQDPGNLGTIIRSCVAFNYQTVILSPNTVDIYNAKVIRATEGMIFKINIVIEDLQTIIPKLKQDGYYIYGTNVEGGTLLEKVNADKHALIIGNEGQGMNDNLINLCDKLLYIDMNPKCESLNAGVSASILMYEINR